MLIRRALPLAFLLLWISAPAKAQSGYTTVTATVKDPTGVTYAGGHGSASFVPSPSATTQALLSGSTFQTDVPISNIDSFGNFTLVLADNNFITDGHAGSDVSKWRFNINSQDGKTNFNCTMVITGASQNITSALQACAAPLPVVGGGGGPAATTIPMSALTFTTTPVFASTANAGYKMTLTANVTSSSTSGIPLNGNILAFNLCQDGTGGRTFAFPGTFTIPGTFSFLTAPNVCNYLAFKYDGANWTFLDSPGGSSGSTAQPPINSLQVDALGVLGGSQFIYNPTDSSSTICSGTCASISAPVNSGLQVKSTDGINAVNLRAENAFGAFSLVSTAVTSPQPVAFGYLASTLIGGTSSPGGCFSSVSTPPCAVSYQAKPGDIGTEAIDGQDIIGYLVQPTLNKAGGRTVNNVGGFVVLSPIKTATGLAPTEAAVNMWGIELQDLQGLGTTMTAGIHIEPQTNASSHAFAIKAEVGSGPSLLGDGVRSAFFRSTSTNPALTGFFSLASADTQCWRNNANSADLCLSKNASDNLIWPNSLSINGTLLVGTGGQATFPNNTGNVAELNFAQTFTAAQNFSVPITVPSGGTGLGTFTTNGVLFGNLTSNLGVTAAGGAGTLCLVETNGGVPTFASCSGSTSTSWSNLTNPSADLSLAMGTNNALFTSGVMTGTRHAWEFVDGNSTSTGSLLFAHTGTTSTMKPFTVTAQGTANGVQMSTSGVLAKIGTGSISADVFTGLAVVANGGTGDTTLAANQLLSGNGTSPVQSVAGSTTGTNPILKLQPSSGANTALTLDTAATPSGDILDLNINTVKTAWFDSSAFLHTPQTTYTGSGPLTLSGTEGTLPSASVGNDILSLGDAATHMAQLSNNGLSFKPIAQITNASPAAHGVGMASVTAPQINFSTAGTSGQPFLSGGAALDGAYNALNLAGGGTIVTGLLPPANGGTGASSLAGANIVTVTGAITVGHCASYQASTVIQDSGGTCGGAGGAPPLHTITAATATNTINSTTFGQIWNWAPAGSLTAFKFGENSAGTGANNVLLNASTLATSTTVPFQADNNGNGWQLSSVGLLQRVGTASAALPGTAHGTVVSEGATSAIAVVSPGTAGQVLISNGAGADPTYQDPIVSQAFVNIWTAQDVTTTRTSNAIRNPIFSQTGTLELTWASITGSPATCTFQVQGVDSQGNALNNGSTFAVSPANGTTSQTFTAAAGLQAAAQIKVIFACVTYPTTGTLTLDFAPIPNVNVTNTVKVDGSAVTQPVSGTVTTTPPANASTNVAQVNGTTTDTNSGTKSAGTLRVVLATDQPQLTNKLLVTPDSVALPANQSVNVNQVAGTATDTNSGNKSAGTIRVVLATDQPALTNKLLVTPDSVALPANQSVNESQINGVTPLMGNGTSGTGSQRVSVASDNTPFETIPVTTATTTDAALTSYTTSAASTNATSVKGSAGNVYGIYIINTTTTNYFLRMYNSSSAPTCSSATGFIETIPALGGAANGGGISRMQVAQGYTTGIGFCLTGGGSSTDNTNAATGVYVTILYK